MTQTTTDINAPRITDISAIAGVSVATVSRVMNGTAKVHPDKAQRVRDAIESLGYQPLRKQRVIAGRTTGKIGVLLFNNDVLAKYSNDFAATIHGVASALADQNLTMVYGDMTSGGQLPREIVEGDVDGLLLAGDADRAGRYTDMPDRPTVWLTSRRVESGGVRALAGNEHVGQIAAEYLIGNGCTRLACMDTVCDGPADEVRCRFFRFTAMQAGLESDWVRGEVHLPSEGTPDGWRQLEYAARGAVAKLMQKSQPPDGLFVTNGLVAGVVYKALREFGVEPGRDCRLIITGYHEPLIAALDPRPAAIDLRGEMIGRCAVQQLLWRIKDPIDKMPVDLMVRAKLIEPA